MVVPVILAEAEASPANERGPTDCGGNGMSEITRRDAMVAAGAVGAVALGLPAASAKDPEDSGERKSAMTKHEMTDKILAAKIAKGATWAAIAEAVGLSEVYTTSACLGENTLSKE